MNSPFCHAVHFWLVDGITDAERETFVEEVKKLANSENVAEFRLGKPAGTPREVVDNSYDFQIVVGFESQAAHDAYQSDEDAVHSHFVATCKHWFAKVLIYDSLSI